MGNERANDKEEEGRKERARERSHGASDASLSFLSLTC